MLVEDTVSIWNFFFRQKETAFRVNLQISYHTALGSKSIAGPSKWKLIAVESRKRAEPRRSKTRHFTPPVPTSTTQNAGRAVPCIGAVCARDDIKSRNFTGRGRRLR